MPLSQYSNFMCFVINRLIRIREEMKGIRFCKKFLTIVQIISELVETHQCVHLY